MLALRLILKATEVERTVGQQWRIQDFPAGAPTPEVGVLIYYFAFFANKCMKMKEFGPRGRGAHAWPSLDPPTVNVVSTLKKGSYFFKSQNASDKSVKWDLTLKINRTTGSEIKYSMQQEFLAELHCVWRVQSLIYLLDF